MNEVYVEYRSLLEQFLSGAMPVEEFQMTYLSRFKNEARRMEEPLFELLDGLFGDIDAFTTDPQLLAECPGYYLDEESLRNRVRSVVSRLATIQGRKGD